MNVINLIGNICAQPELKQTNNGKPVCSVNIAVKKPFKKDETDFIPLQLWNKTAEIFCQYVQKGQQVGVTGSLQTRNYEDKNGNKRTAFEVVVDSFDFCGSKSEGAKPQSTNNDFVPISDTDDLPWD